MKRALVVGGGPAGLMAAEELAKSGAEVTLIEAKPSVGRKFLMAGKSGLNLTKNEPMERFLDAYSEARPWLSPMLAQFGPTEIQNHAASLGQALFTGSTGRVFPESMKASPLLRAWMARLQDLGVTVQTRWRWSRWDDTALTFDTPQGEHIEQADAVVFALGGASWAKLGSDGTWARLFTEKGIACTEFGPANAAIDVRWSDHMTAHFGAPLKNISLTAGPYTSRGEAVISRKGLEGGGVYSVSRGVREGHAMFIDLRPDMTGAQVSDLFNKPRGKASLSNYLRRVIKMSKVEQALLNEWARPLPSEAGKLADVIKRLPVEHAGLLPIDEAISTSGGVARIELTDTLMLKQMPGFFCAGEMLDWEAPTGGYLLTACYATGRTAGRGAARYLGLTPS